MTDMFNGATAFNQSLANWNISNVTSMTGFLTGGALSTANYDATLTSWSKLTLQPALLIDMGSSKYSQAAAARTAILNEYTGANAITINDGGFIDTVAANAASANVTLNTACQGSLAGDANSAGGYALTYSKAAGGTEATAHGSVTINADGYLYLYANRPITSAADSFTYQSYRR